MSVSLFIDSNAWDVLFERGVNLHAELPIDEFLIQITREAEFEISHMPSEKRRYVEAAIETRGVKTDVYFGFYDESLPPEQQRVAGFDIGRFASDEELEILRKESSLVGPTMRPTGLYKNEADVSLAARSVVSAVLTCDGKRALKRAKALYGGTVLDLKKWDSETVLGTFIRRELCSSRSHSC